jgi:hypothetical protein
MGGTEVHELNNMGNKAYTRDTYPVSVLNSDISCSGVIFSE